MSDEKQPIYNPFTKKTSVIDPYGRTAKKIYKYQIAGGATADSVLPENLNYANGRFKKIKIKQDLSGVRRVTYNQIRTIPKIETYIRNLFKEYTGQTITRIIKYTVNGESVEESQTVQIPSAYASWWKREGLHFFMIDSEILIFDASMNADLEPKFQAQLLILSQNKVDGEDYNQYFLDGVNHCFLHPIKTWAEGCLEKSKSKSAEKKYKAIINKVLKLNIDFVDGVNESDIGQICDNLQIGIQIDLPSTSIDKKTKYIDYKSHKKPLKVFKFINTRLNHIELNECQSKDEYIECTQTELTEIHNTMKDSGEFIMWKNRAKGISQINTLHNVYKLTDKEGYLEAVLEFEKENNLRDYKVNHYDNPELSQFLKDNCHINQSIILDEDYNLEQLKHIDMQKSYSRGMDCPQYEGYLAKVTDFRQCNEIVGLGIYEIENINFHIAEHRGNELIENLKVLHSGEAYPSPELKYYQSLGITFDIVAGCWGSSFDIKFTDNMFKKEYDVSHYCKWYGTLMMCSLKERYNFTCENLQFAKLNAKNEGGADIRFNEHTGHGLIEYNKKDVYHNYHIAAFVTSYARLNMFNQLKQFEDIKQIVAVQVDGIYYTGDVEMTNLFEKKEKQTIESIKTEEFIQPSMGCVEHEDLPVNRPHGHNLVEVHTGAGGCGKTHYNLTDKGLQSILYVAPSWKLARRKKKDYPNCEVSVFYYLLDDDPERWREILKKYSTVIVDEISMLSDEDKYIILNRYSKLKIIFCGDLGYQLPPISPLFDKIKKTEFIVGNLPVIEHTTNHRCKCPELAGVLTQLRELIKNGVQFVDNSSETLFGKNIISSDNMNYNIEDMILATTHRAKDFYTQKYKHMEKYCVLSNSKDLSNGEIVIGPKPVGVHAEIRHAWTVHSAQGETATHQLFIELQGMRKTRSLYTAISRAKYWNQVIFVKQ